MSMQDTILPHGLARAITCAAPPRIAGIASANHNLRWYENLGPAKTTRR